MTDEKKQLYAWQSLQLALLTCKEAKPNDRSVEDRAYAVVITDLEKTVAYFSHWVIGNTPARELP